MTDQISTTKSGLSEGILWDYTSNDIAHTLLDYYKIPEEMIPKYHDSFRIAGELTSSAAEELGLVAGIPVSYRAGDQPNNAFSLNVLNNGEIATTAGTSGVIYAVSDTPLFDSKSRVNSFIHVNHNNNTPSYGILLCINGTGILNRWIKNNLLSDSIGYDQMNQRASTVRIGSEGLTVFPFGNGSERIFENQNPGAAFVGLDFNRHQAPHIMRAAQEGIVFAMKYGFNIMKEMGVKTEIIRAGMSNLFLSPLFCEAFVNITQSTLELYNTDGSEGAARGAGFGAGVYNNLEDAFTGLKKIKTLYPDESKYTDYQEAGNLWLKRLKNHNFNR